MKLENVNKVWTTESQSKFAARGICQELSCQSVCNWTPFSLRSFTKLLAK